MKGCSIEGCERPMHGRGWCRTHHMRWLRHGDPLIDRINKRGPCLVEGCDRLTDALGMCPSHYVRWRSHGDARVSVLGLPPIERLLSRITVHAETGCWLHTRITSDGYATVFVDGEPVAAHRYAYEFWVGPIPDGMHVDHVWARGCRFKHCVNPDHLEPVTPAENTRRWVAAMAAQR